jgi:CRISPR-associated endonuclease/helicase Cas3
MNWRKSMMDTMNNEATQRVINCWGKTERGSMDPEVYHPAIYHMLDVGHVAQILLGQGVSIRWKKLLSSVMGTTEDNISIWMPFVISLHDIGKISASFQCGNTAQLSRLTSMGYTFKKNSDLFHPQIGQSFIWNEWPQDTKWNIPQNLRKSIREMISGHHGQFASPGELAFIHKTLRQNEPIEWRDLRQNSFFILADIFLRGSLSDCPEPSNISAAVMAMTGFTILCDWIGSDQRFFTPQPKLSLSDYNNLSMELAVEAVKVDGFLDTFKSEEPTIFQEIFKKKIPNPRPLQLAIDDLPSNLFLKPALYVIEAPTGEGKTEAALALAHRIASSTGSDELYYALPTMATSNQMFLRVQEYIRDQLNLKSRVKLVHGQAFLIEDDLSVKPLSNGKGDGENNDVLDWFGPKKRALLAPFGVGTIDQIELGALNVRHASLRLSGLSGKVVILDEVHAYDTYMTTIIEKLLTWLAALGSSVILLSATLPQSRREALLHAYTGKTKSAGEQRNDYPAIWVGSKTGNFALFTKASQPTRELQLNYLHFTEDQVREKAQWLVDAVREGGCACWITNSVKRAQQIFQAVDEIAPSNTDRMILHARYPLSQRQVIEKQLIEKYGPDKSKRPPSGIVIGTQVLEQSLDLDFDAMVSDLAPIDLLLQRAGRLHRHAETKRPANLQSPCFVINIPRGDDQTPIITMDKYIYAEYFPLRTIAVLCERKTLQLPADFRGLVEEVYDILPVEMDQNTRNAFDKLTKDEANAKGEAKLRLLPDPDPEDLFTGQIAQMSFTESETNASWIVAQTRLGEMSVNVIPLEDLGEAASIPGSDITLKKGLAASRDDQLKMLQSGLRISQIEVVKAVLCQKADLPVLFTKSPLLRDYLPLWLKEGKTEIATQNGIYDVILDQKLGLIIEKIGG